MQERIVTRESTGLEEWADTWESTEAEERAVEEESTRILK